MSNYYKYTFVSPQSICAEIRQEMKSYFNTGVIDDTMFPIYITNYLDKLGNGSYIIDWAVMPMDCFKATLPDDFYKVRELWSCHTVIKPYVLPTAYYSNRTCKVVADYGEFDPCNPCDKCDPCSFEQSVVFKTNTEIQLTYKFSHLLKPGNIHASNYCKDSPNPTCTSLDTFDISGRNIMTNIESGVLYLTFYKKELDEEGYPLIPDNYNIQEGLRAFLKYKMYELLFNEVTDETAIQIQGKYQVYKQEWYEKLVNAQNETKKQTVEQKVQAIKFNRGRLNSYKIR